MNPAAAITGSIVRWLLTALIAFAVGHKWLSEEQAGGINIASISAWLVPILVPLVWGIYSHLHGKAKLAVALSLPAGVSESRVDTIVAGQTFKESLASAPTDSAAAKSAIRNPPSAILLLLLLPAFLFASCQTTGNIPATSAAAQTTADVEAAATQAIRDYAQYKAGNRDMTYALAEGIALYQTGTRSGADLKAIVKAWTGNTGDSQKLADRLARIFAASPLPPEQKAAAITTAAVKVSGAAP